MSGIVGIVGAREPIDAQIIVAMRDRLAHRGPDDAGLAFARDGCSAFGHRRLAVLDPTAAGHEPMWNRSRTLLAACDGGVTNFRELKAELSGAGYAFGTRSDTEVLLAAFEHQGLAAVERLCGSFAFAIWSEEARECILARDRLGAKPLFYTVVDGALHFASEATALLAAPRVPRDLDIAALGDYLAHGYVLGGRSIWRGIFKLPPAHTLVFRSGEDGRVELDARRYWAPLSTPNTGPNTGDVNLDLVADLAASTAQTGTTGFRAALEEAVRLALISDVPVGAFLSGGLDSSVLLALMGATGEPVHSYTLAFDGPANGHGPETAYARRVAERYAAEHHERRFTPDRSLDTLARVVASYDEPVAHEAMVPAFLLAEDVAAEVKLVVSSEGGSLLFGGERSRGKWIARSGARSIDQVFRERGFFDATSRRALLDPMLAREMDDDVLAPFRPYWHPELPLSLRLDLLEIHTALADRSLTCIDRAGMHHALETRLPFLDHHLIERVLRLSLAAVPLRRDGQQILKESLEAMARELLPEPEHAPQPRPSWEWMRTARTRFGSWLADQQSGRAGAHPASSDLVAEHGARLRSGELARRALVKPAAVDKLLAHPSGGNSKRAWSLLVLDLWLETHLGG